MSGGTLLATFSKSGSLFVLEGIFPNPKKLGSKSIISPVESTIPLSMPKFELIALKKPTWIGSP